jgi:hypothetical protein
VDVRLSSLSPGLAGCYFYNNPAIAVEAGNIYLLAECFELLPGGSRDESEWRTVVFRARLEGPPPDWTWEYVGSIANHADATELGAGHLVSPNVARAVDGSLLVLYAPKSGAAQGCVALELESIDPPVLRRDCDGGLVVRARQTANANASWHTGACTYDPGSSTGIIMTAVDASSGFSASLHATTLKP